MEQLNKSSTPRQPGKSTPKNEHKNSSPGLNHPELRAQAACLITDPPNSNLISSSCRRKDPWQKNTVATQSNSDICKNSEIAPSLCSLILQEPSSCWIPRFEARSSISLFSVDMLTRESFKRGKDLPNRTKQML